MTPQRKEVRTPPCPFALTGQARRLVLGLLAVTLAACDSTPSEPEPEDVEEVEEVDVRVSGGVVDADTGDPVEGAEVAVYRVDDEAALDTAITGVAGSYELLFTVLESEVPEELRIRAERFGFQGHEEVVGFVPSLSYDIALAEGNREIATVEALQKIGNDPDYPLDAGYVLVSDIDASATADWDEGRGFDPIGHWDGFVDPDHRAFTGTFDGNGHTITGLTIDRPDETGVGLFGLAVGRVENVALGSAEVHGAQFVGALVGVNAGDGLVRQASVDATISGDDAGGLVGFNNHSEVHDAYALGSVVGQGTAGGLVGLNEGLVLGAFAAAGVEGQTAGGLVGSGRDGAIVGSYWDVEASGQEESGGEGTGAVGLTTTEMTGAAAQENMPDLDFQEVWQAVADDYPTLRVFSP